MSEFRKSVEIEQEKAALVAEAEAIHTRSKNEQVPQSDKDRADECLTRAEQLDSELVDAYRHERIASEKAKLNSPSRPAVAPTVPAQYRSKKVSDAEGFSCWLAGLMRGGNPDLHYRAKASGYDIGSLSHDVNVSYDRLNFKRRTIMSTGGTYSGAEWTYNTYADKVVEYLTYFSPLLGMVDSDTTADGNPRTYFKIDSTGMRSTYTSDSGGSEVNPTIPETNAVSAQVVLGAFPITSGYQKFTWEETQDSHSSINLLGKVAKWNADSHARQIEHELILAEGDGTTGVMGLTEAATELDPVDAFTQVVLKRQLASIPYQYRLNACFVSNSKTQAEIDIALTDDIGRSLFDKTVADNIEFPTLFGKRFVISEWVPDDKVFCFVPEFYMLRMVAGQRFDVLRELFHPHVAYAGEMRFGGGFLGPAECCNSVSLGD